MNRDFTYSADVVLPRSPREPRTLLGTLLRLGRDRFRLHPSTCTRNRRMLAATSVVLAVVCESTHSAEFPCQLGGSDSPCLCCSDDYLAVLVSHSGSIELPRSGVTKSKGCIDCCYPGACEEWCAPGVCEDFNYGRCKAVIDLEPSYYPGTYERSGYVNIEAVNRDVAPLCIDEFCSESIVVRRFQLRNLVLPDQPGPQSPGTDCRYYGAPDRYIGVGCECEGNDCGCPCGGFGGLFTVPLCLVVTGQTHAFSVRYSPTGHAAVIRANKVPPGNYTLVVSTPPDSVKDDCTQSTIQIHLTVRADGPCPGRIPGTSLLCAHPSGSCPQQFFDATEVQSAAPHTLTAGNATAAFGTVSDLPTPAAFVDVEVGAGPPATLMLPGLPLVTPK